MQQLQIGNKMADNNLYSDLESLDVMALEEIVKENPWFSYARHLLLIKLKEISDEVYQTHLRNSAVFLSSRLALYKRINLIHKEIKSEEAETEEKIVKIASPKTKYVVVGGDFFQKEDFEELTDEENVELQLKESPFYRPEQKRDNRGKLVENNFYDSEGKVKYDDLVFYTETLGHIYAQQGYYDQAIEVFSKLILLYPQKSAYFATLIKETEKNKEI